MMMMVESFLSVWTKAVVKTLNIKFKKKKEEEEGKSLKARAINNTLKESLVGASSKSSKSWASKVYRSS